jgi:endogenous inhibitor of DNA gyrase (YacG/DUF329 family)
MPKVTFACQECGKETERFPSQPMKFCSVECRAKNKARLGMPTKPRRGQEVPCPICGTMVYRNKSEQKSGRRFCSIACANIGKRLEPVVKSCEWCGKELVLKPSQAATRFCSKKCETEADIKRPLERMHNGRRAKKDNQGYVMVWEPSHPNKAFSGWQYEHRLVAEAVIGRYLESREHVHHINGVKDDNRPENLEVMDGLEHAALSAREHRDKVLADRAELEEYRKRFGPLAEEN